MRDFEEEVKKELAEIGEVIKGESSIDNGVGIYSDRVMTLFYRMFPEIEKMVTLDRM